MGDEAWNQNEVERPLTEDLVRDVDAIVGLGVMSLRCSTHITIPAPSKVLGLDSAFSLMRGDLP